MNDSTFDPSVYVRPPALTVESGLSLARALVGTMPRGMSAVIKKSAERLARAADSAQEALMRRQREQNSPREDDRALDVETDQAWRSLFGRLEHYALLPSERYPRAVRAAELMAALSPGLNEVLGQTYIEQVASMDTLLKRIDDEGLGGDMNSLCGPEFLAHVRDCQTRYQAMVQRRLAAPGSSSENLQAHVRALGRAIVEYATRVAASVDEDDADSLSRAMTALRPIDNHRESLARGATASKEPSSDPAPVPPAPAPPPTPTP